LGEDYDVCDGKRFRLASEPRETIGVKCPSMFW
jgi:hypothetical protein